MVIAYSSNFSASVPFSQSGLAIILSTQLFGYKIILNFQFITILSVSFLISIKRLAFLWDWGIIKIALGLIVRSL